MPTLSPDRQFRWVLFRWLFRAFVVVVTCLALFYSVETWQARRALRKFQETWAKQGERFDLAAVIPTNVPPEQNFAMTPFLAALLDYEYTADRREAVWRDTNAFKAALEISIFQGEGRDKARLNLGNPDKGTFTDLAGWQAFYRDNTNFPAAAHPGSPGGDVLHALNKYRPVLDEIESASHRPYAIFPTHYQEGHLALLPYLATVKSLAQMLSLRAIASQAQNEPENAARDIKLVLYLGEALKSEPLLISQFVRLATIQLGLSAFWEGSCQHRWTEAQLSSLQAQFGAIHVLEGYPIAMRGERAFAHHFIEQLRRKKLRLDSMPDGEGGEGFWTGRLMIHLYPAGWFYRNELLLDRLYQELALPLVNPAAHRVFPESAPKDEPPDLQQTGPFNLFVRKLFPAVGTSAQKFAFTQTFLDLARTGCALERYRLATGAYPPDLGALVPKFLEKIPTDVIDGQALRYRRETNDKSTLYSIGWNGKDDQGTVVPRGRPKGNQPLQGDWVWRCPER